MASKIICDLYLLRCVTNLHTGSGDTNYGIVDKTVQRDPIDSTPVIHASGIKGALREAFVFNKGDNDTIVETIFGTDTKTMNDNPEKARAGQFHFYGARLLFIPVRTNRGQYFLATTQEIILDFQKVVLDDFGINLTDDQESLFNNLTLVDVPQKGAPYVFVDDSANLMVDEFEAANGGGLSGEFCEIEASKIALFNRTDLAELCNNRLPVIARNHLNNGISTNLWYEEVVPREARFYFIVSRPAELDHFEEGLKTMNHRIQIGGNASVGYGLCQLTRIKSSSEQ